MKNKTIIRICGIYNFLCAVFHVILPGKFNWSDILQKLAWTENHLIAAPLFIMNWCMMVLWIISGILYLKNADEIENTSLGRTMLGLMVCFWIIRIFILQPIYISLSDPVSFQMVPFFSIGLILNAIPFGRIMLKKK